MKRIYIFNTLLIIALLVIYFIEYRNHTREEAINVGILFSESGSMAGSERVVMRATLLAIEEINQQGGVKGRPVIPIIYDAESKIEKYPFLAKKMIIEDKVDVIFGCWTSSSRKLVKPIVEEYNKLLIYSVHSEGVEESQNIIYLGSVPNQQLVPAAFWMLQHYGKKAYFVGSEYIAPYVSHEILAHSIEIQGGEMLGEHYFPLGGSDVDRVIEDIIQKKPDFIFSVINGSTNTVFFQRLYELTVAKGIRRPPVMSFSLPSSAINKIGMSKMVGDLATWSYFITEDNLKNREFLNAYMKEYGSVDEISSPAVTAYSGVYLWAQAMNHSPAAEGSSVRDYILDQSIASPAGAIYVDPNSAYAWRTVEIAEITQKEQYNIVWRSEAPIEPIVYPDFKTKAEWNFFEYKYYLKHKY